MTLSEMHAAFLCCLPVICNPNNPRYSSIRYDFISEIIYWWDNTTDTIKTSCKLAYDDLSSTTIAPLEKIEIDEYTDRYLPLSYVMDKKIRKIFKEKKPVVLKAPDTPKMEFNKIDKLILKLNKEKTVINLYCVCEDKYGRVEKLAKYFKEKKSVEHLNYKSVMDLFNKICLELPTVKKLTEKRKAAIRSAKEDGIDFASFFLKIHKSDYLSGRSGKWKCDFDWCLRPSNRARIIEGSFDNIEEKSSKHSASYDIEALENNISDPVLEEFINNSKKEKLNEKLHQD